MESSYSNPRSYGPQLPAKLADIPPPPDNDRTTAELRALDCNLTSLCDHILTEGFTAGSFSDIVVRSMGSTYHLHRLILSRSSYFRNMLHGPWKEAGAPIVTLQVDDKNVNEEAIAISLAYLYGHHPKLNDNNAFRVLAAASFLDLQDLCAICTDFIISELWTSNFLAYQVFAENQDYGIHGERVRNACWGYLCQSGAVELKEVLPKLSSHTLHALLTSDELWVPSEEKRFELALYALLAKGALNRTGNVETVSCDSNSSKLKGKNLADSHTNKNLESKVECLSLKDDMDGHTPRPFAKLQDCAVDLTTRVSSSEQLIQHPAYAHTSMEPVYPCDRDYLSSLSSSFADSDGIRPSCSYVEVPVGVGTSELMTADVALEGPSEDGSCYHLNNSNWIPSVQSMNCSSMGTSCNGYMLNDWGRCSMSSFSWGGRVVGKRQVKSFDQGNSGVHGDEYDTFFSIFEGGSLLYCSMTFDALLNVKNQLEELGFPCKAVNDGLWLQTLLRQRVQEAAANTCKSCCLTTVACACRQPLGLSHGVAPTSYYMQDHDQNNIPGNMTGVYVQGDANGIFRPVRVHVRGRIDGLAGIGRRTAFAPAAGWPPTRFVFSRVPFGMANRSGQQSLPYDDSEARGDRNGDVSGDGLTALVGLSQGGHNSGQGEQIDSASDMDQQSRFSAISASAPTSSCISMQMMESPEHNIGIEWENENNSISLDLKTPLSHFPPFRFGVEFEDVHRLCDGPDGQVKHSAEFFYAGSLWKISVQAFNDEDPQGRRTLGLFLHRRKAELTDAVRKVHIYVDSREKVTARYQLICPSKREVMVFGSFKQRGTLLPKAPKGWGWRTALLFDELADLLQNGALRVAAVVQLVEN